MKNVKIAAIPLALTCLVAFANTSHASNDCKQKTVFSCQTKSKKVIQVCQVDNSLVYSYGRASNPEIIMRHDFDEVIKSPWNGVGYSYNYSIGFPNGETTYDVYGSYDREVDSEYSAGVLVNFNQKDITIECDADKEIIDNIDEFLNSH